jgi:regulator of sirC expression with transglutaminase-like and TPR domain
LLATNEIKALFSLMDDPDYEVYNTVAEKLLECGKVIIPSLEHLWETVDDEIVQERIATLIHRVHFQDLQQELKEWCSSKNPELMRGAILVARYQYPDLNVPFLLTQFDQIRRNLWLELNNYLTPIEKINVFNSILYNYYKLHGHELSEHKPDNFFINILLESKKGNPYSIGVLFLALSELLDIPIFAVDIPRQFLLAYFDILQHFYTTDNTIARQISFYIDPLNGMIYTQTDVDNYLHKIKAAGARHQFLKPQSSVQTIYKLLEELSLCYRYNKDDERAEEIQQLMRIIGNEKEDE